MNRLILILILNAVVLMSCNKDAAPLYDSAAKAPLSIEFDNIAGGADLLLNNGHYTNAVGEKFTVTKLKYFVSNFVLTSIDGTVYTVPQDSSYFMIDESDKSTDQPVVNLPEGEYKALTFTVGIDSLRNTMDISKRTGVLDPATTAADMYWGWNSGYIFLKIEGTSPASTAAGNAYMYHVGGFGGYNTPTPNNIKTVTLDLTARGTPKVKAGKKTNIHLFVDVLRVLNGSSNISFAEVSMIHSALAAIPLANNYTQMFKHDHTEN
jgi:hypothetical protein